MNITDTFPIVILISSSFVCATIGFITGSTLQRIKGRQEQLYLWSQAEKLYRDRALIDTRDDAPLQNFRSVE